MDKMVERYGLHATPYDQIANWAFVDWMLNFGEETILSRSRSATPVSETRSTRMQASNVN